jgi:regulatory protein YycI of two-component signal transduction system YycFG
MKEQKKKRSKVMSMVDVAVGYAQEPYLKHKDKVSAKSFGKLVGYVSFQVAKPLVSIYDGFKEGFNGKEETERHSKAGPAE